MPRLRSVALACSLVVLAALAAPAAPDQPANLEWRAVGRASALRWDAPGGDSVHHYEMRGSERPIGEDQASFEAASELAFYPTGTPRPPGVLEFRELEEVAVAEGEDVPTVLETALYFAVRAVDDGGGVGPVAATDGFDLVRVRAQKPNRAGLRALVVKGRFAIRRAVLDVTSGDVRVRLVQNDVTILDETVPAAVLASRGSSVRAKKPTTVLRLVEFAGSTFAFLTVKTERIDLPLDAGDVSVLLDLGDRPFAAEGTLRVKGRTLVYP